MIFLLFLCEAAQSHGFEPGLVYQPHVLNTQVGFQPGGGAEREQSNSSPEPTQGGKNKIVLLAAGWVDGESKQKK